MKHLEISPDLRSRHAENFTGDAHGNEVLVGLSRDETERLLFANPFDPNRKSGVPERKFSRERLGRAVHFWAIARMVPDAVSNDMTAEGAYELGYGAWNAFAGLKQDDDFRSMVAGVPRQHRIAAVHGWLAAFDDQAERLGK